jgi:hypothetical protein
MKGAFTVKTEAVRKTCVQEGHVALAVKNGLVGKSWMTTGGSVPNA